MKFAVNFESMINVSGIAHEKHSVRILIVLLGLLFNSYPTVSGRLAKLTINVLITESIPAVEIHRGKSGRYGTTIRGVLLHHHTNTQRWRLFIHRLSSETVSNYLAESVN